MRSSPPPGAGAGEPDIAGDESGAGTSSSTAPARKQTAPQNVPDVSRAASSRSPVDGCTHPAIAEMPKNTDPIRFSAPILQPGSEGRHENQA